MSALIRDNEWRIHVRHTVGAWCKLEFADDVQQLSTLAAMRAPDIVLWHLDQTVDSTELAYAAVFRRLRRESPSTVLVAYGQVDRTIAPLLLIAGRVGVDRVLLRGFDDLEFGLRSILHSSTTEATVRDVLAQLDLPSSSATLAFAHCLRRASVGSITVRELARDLHVNRKTVSIWLRQARLPAPESLIGWSRVLGIALALGDSRRSVAQVARGLGFSSPTDLRRMISRYLGCTPTEMRRAGGVTMVVSALRAQMTRNAIRPCEESNGVPSPHRATGAPHRPTV